MKDIWAPLTEENIINCVENSISRNLTSLCLKRNSYINRVYELEEEDTRERLIIKFYRPGRWTKEMISEEVYFVRHIRDLELPVIPAMEINGKSLFEFSGINYSIYPKMGGRTLDEFDEEMWQEIGRIIGRLHLASEKHTSSDRIIWEPNIATRHHLETILNSGTVPKDFAPPLTETVNEFIKKTNPLFESSGKILLHGDCHRGNFIFRPNEGIYIIDFDDMCIGPSVQDMWMLLPDSVENSKNEINNFIKGYETFREFNSAELSLIDPLRAMRMVHFASWCAIQSNEPHFEKHFPEWGNTKYWNQLIRDIREITASLPS